MCEFNFILWFNHGFRLFKIFKILYKVKFKHLIKKNAQNMNRLFNQIRIYLLNLITRKF